MKDKMHFSWKAKVWKYSGPAGWFFVYVPDNVSAKIKKAVQEGHATVGFGFVPVSAVVGATRWETTIFPTKEGPYLIAIKANVRRAEAIMEGDTIRITCELSNKKPAQTSAGIRRRGAKSRVPSARR